MKSKLDKKDLEILRILNEDFRASFSKIAKKVALSKNSTRLRFQKLKSLMLNNTVGIDNKLLGYTLVKIFYSIDYFDEIIENKIVGELEKHRNVVYVARYYGHYNLEIAIFVHDFDELNYQIKSFNEKFAKFINEKEIEIIVKEFFFRNSFLYEGGFPKALKVAYEKKKQAISNTDKNLLRLLRKDPRMSIVDLSSKSSLNPRTVIEHLKSLEKSGIIIGYFMKIDNTKFNLNAFKLLVQITNRMDESKFEEYLSSLKSLKHFSRFLGLWDYEIDVLYPSVLELQQQIEILKMEFPKQIKKIEIISHGKRILTNQESFLY